MIDVPDPPKGSAISIERSGDRTKLSWATQRNIGLLGLLAFLAAQGLVLPQLLEEAGELEIVLGIVWTVLNSLLVVGEYQRQGVAQHLVLTIRDVEYSRSPGQELRIKREDVRQLSTKGRGRRCRIVIDFARDDVPIGRRIPQGDREYLASALRRWLDGPHSGNDA